MSKFFGFLMALVVAGTLFLSLAWSVNVISGTGIKLEQERTRQVFIEQTQETERVRIREEGTTERARIYESAQTTRMAMSLGYAGTVMVVALSIVVCGGVALVFVGRS